MYGFPLCLVLLSLSMASSRPTFHCGDKAADVVFMVDTSSSIWQPDFNKHVLPFVRDVVSMFDIGPSITQTRVGMVTFGNEFYHQFHLNDFHTKEDIAAAIDETHFKGGNTYTHKALDYVTKEMFTKTNGARDGVVHIAVVLTDGGSDVPEKTMDAVALAKENGVQIFSVGVGERLDYTELKAMASQPTDEFMFHVGNFQALGGIKKQLAIKTCEVTAEPDTTTQTKQTTTATTTTTTEATTTTTTRPITTTNTHTQPTAKTTDKMTNLTSPTVNGTESKYDLLELPQGDQARVDPEAQECKKIPADVYFILDVSSSLWETHFDTKVLPFVHDQVKTFDIGPTKSRVGIVTFADNITPVFGLNDYTSKEEVLKAIKNTNYTGEGKTNTASAISYVRQKGFAVKVARKDVAQIVVVITDGLSFETSLTAMEAQAAKTAGMYMFAIGVGPSVDPAEMKAIGSEPEDRFVFHVNTYDALSGVKDILVAETCNLKEARRPDQMCHIEATDMMFVFESASKSPSSRRILRSVITDFAEKMKVRARQVKIGSLTDPCPAEEELSFLSLESFRKKVGTIVEKKESKIHILLKKLRLDDFNEKKTRKTEDPNRKVGVVFLDNKTVAPTRVVAEATKLRDSGVELYVVTVGDVSEYMVAGVASDDSHVIRLNSYRHLKSVKLDQLWNICA